MAEDISDKIKAMLNNPEMMNMLSGLINSEKSEQSAPVQEDSSMTQIANLMREASSGNDKRINLLNALRPYMRGSRASDIDKAVKMLKITKLSSIFKDF